MKNIYVNNETLNEAVKYINNEITFFGFLSHVKMFLKKLLMSPSSANIDDYLLDNGLTKNNLLKLLVDYNIIEKDTEIKTIDNSDKFILSYKVPKKNFERKIKRLYYFLFEKNEIASLNNLFEDGATSCGSAMQCGGSNPDSGQYVSPLGKVQRRKIYVTNEQAKMLNEIGLSDVNNYQYDTPFNLKDKNDPSYNHKNIFANGFKNKKRGVRNKS